MPTGAAQLSSKSVEWRTPRSLALKYIDLHGLTTDVCATHGMEQLPHYFSPQQNGLVQSWQGLRCWMNPPYGRGLKEWVRKACLEVMFCDCEVVVALLPVRTDTTWWHEFIIGKAHVEFLKGRLKFETPTMIDLDEGRVLATAPTQAAPFPSAIVTWER